MNDYFESGEVDNAIVADFLIYEDDCRKGYASATLADMERR